MKRIRDVFPGSWQELSAGIKEQRERLFGELPSIDAVDISDIDVPTDVLHDIRMKNLRRVRDEIGVDDLTAQGSPYRTDAFFDDQLLEVMAANARKYHPLDFIRQIVRFIEIFLNESAAFRTGLILARLKDEDANQAVDIVRKAIESAPDDDTRSTLELLLLDLTNGGEEPWIAALSPQQRAFLSSVIERQKA